jgi:hypothetical protein
MNSSSQSTKKSSGKPKFLVCLGRTRNTVASINRTYNYYSRPNDSNISPYYSLFNFPINNIQSGQNYNQQTSYYTLKFSFQRKTTGKFNLNGLNDIRNAINSNNL